MAVIHYTPTVNERIQAAPELGKKITIAIGEGIRLAADLSNTTGFQKHDAVREGVKAIFLPQPAGEDEIKQFLDDLLAFSGWAEVATDAIIRVVPIERLLDSFLDFGIRAAYRGMKDAGIAL